MDESSGVKVIELNKPFWFLHVPRTSGKTLRKSLRPNIYLRGGHMEYGHAKQRSVVNPILVVMLRNPIKRWISQYYWIKKKAKKGASVPRFAEVKRHCTADKFLEKCYESTINVNTMTKMIAGEPSLNTYEPTCCQTRKYTDREMKIILDTAKYNILKFEHVGLREGFQPFYEMLCKTYGFKPEPVRRRGVGKYRGNPFANLDLLSHINEYDIALYDFVKEHLEC